MTAYLSGSVTRVLAAPRVTVKILPRTTKLHHIELLLSKLQLLSIDLFSAKGSTF